MKCPQCGKSSNVTISGKVYCTSCGAVIQDTAPSANSPQEAQKSEQSTANPAAAAGSLAPANSAPKRMDIGGPVAKVAAAPPPAPAERPVVTPITAAPTMQDVMRPAAAYHNQVTASGEQVAAKEQAAAASDPQPSADAAAANLPPVSPDSPPPPAPVIEHTTVPVPAPASPVEARLAAAQAVPKADGIIKFHPPVAPSESAAPAPAPAVAPAEAPAPAPAVQDGLPPGITIDPSLISAAPPAPPVTPEPEAAAAPAAAAVPAPAPELPAPAQTAHEALQNLQPSPQDALNQVLGQAVGPKPAAVGAAALAVLVMGGYIWLQNYPRMQLSAAAGRAGFTATLPGYLPSSYQLDGPVQASQGLVSLHYRSPGLPDLTIKQQVTSWDAASLADNYVAMQDPSFATVNGQGLTLYLFGQGQASWVNHGIWYTIAGASHLSREQLLKLAGSL